MKKARQEPRPRRRRSPDREYWAVGDPQTSFRKFIGILEHHGLLGREHRLRDDVSLLSIGDHFDYTDKRGFRAAGEEGLRILRWLAAHPPDRAILLAGNHDLARVMELGTMTDRRFEEARTIASEVDRHPEDSERRKGLEREFSETFPELPTSEAARRDYRTWSEEQRALIQELLLSGRMGLAQAAVKNDRPILLTHAGITGRELGLLGLPPECDPAAAARQLNGALAEAVTKVREPWSRGRALPLDLGTLHVPGRGGREGGGLLYHRPGSAPDRSDPGPLARRRFHPTDLPVGLVQACGHTVHEKCLQPKQLAPWVAPSARRKDLHELRTLRVRGLSILYESKDSPARPGEAVLYMIDGAMNTVKRPEHYPLFRLDRWA